MRSGTLAPRSAADLSSVLILAEVPDYGAMPSRITVANAQVPNRASLSAAEDSCTSRLNGFQEICYGRRGRLAMRLATRGGRPLRSIASANFIGASLIAAENSCVYRRPLIAKDSCASRIIAEMSESLLPGPICDCISIYTNFFAVSRSVQRNGMERCSLGGGLLCLLEVAESIKNLQCVAF